MGTRCRVCMSVALLAGLGAVTATSNSHAQAKSGGDAEGTEAADQVDPEAAVEHTAVGADVPVPEAVGSEVREPKEAGSEASTPMEEDSEATDSADAPSVSTPLAQTGLSSAASTQHSDPAWDANFLRARQEILEGRLPEAHEMLEVLLRSASSEVDRARAATLLELTEEYRRRGLVPFPESELAGSSVLARRQDRRTGDEIGVLYTAGVLYGLGSGLVFDVLSDADSAAGLVFPPLLLGGAAAAGIALLDSGEGLRYGSAQAIATGMEVGLWLGISWTTYYQASSSSVDQLEPDSYALVLWGTTTAGAITGGVVGQVNRTTPGRGAFVSSASLWSGLVMGFAAAGIAPDNDRGDDRALLAASVGTTGGAVAGMVLAGDVAPTTARVRFLDLGGLSGGLLVGGLYLGGAGRQANAQTLLFTTALGMTGGLAIAWALTDSMPRDEGARTVGAGPKPVSIAPTLIPLEGGGMSFGLAGMM